MSVLIWTTTPWTIPSNLGIAFHPDFVYGAYDVDGKAVIVAKDLAEAVAKKTGKSFDKLVATFEGKQMERLVFRHPIYARDSLGVLGDYVTLEAGTGAVHTAPGHGSDDYKTGVRYGLEIYAPLDPGGHFNESVEMFAGLKVTDANPKIEAGAQGQGLPLASRGLRSLVSALLALPQPGDLPRHVAVVHRDGREGPARARAQVDPRDALDPVVGAGAHRGHDRQPARLVHLAPARLGRADPGDGLREVRHAGADQGAHRQGGVGV